MKRRIRPLATWTFWIHRGSTFTDVIGRDPSGRSHVETLLTHGMDDDAALAGMRRILELPPRATIPDGLVESVRWATSAAADALRARTGERVLLVTTRGFRDALEIGDQARPDVYALNVVKPEQLYAGVLEVDERVRADGSVEKKLDAARLRADLERAHVEGYRAAAVVFMHAPRHPAHESEAMEILADVGFTQISASHVVAPHESFVARGHVAVAHACLTPSVARDAERFLGAIGVTTRSSRLTSSGELEPTGALSGPDAVLSGPAASVIGLAETARVAGIDRIIGFDMDDAATHVSHYAGAFERVEACDVAGVRLRGPMMRICAVTLDGEPVAEGKAIWRRDDGPLTIGDASVVTGKSSADASRAVSGAAQYQARAKFAALAAESGYARSAEQIADEFIARAVAQIARAIGTLSVSRGHDVTQYVLNCAGAASGRHACLVADALGVRRVLVHPMSPVMSAYRLAFATPRVSRRESVDAWLDARGLRRARAVARRLRALVETDMRRQVNKKDIATRVSLSLKAAGSGLIVDLHATLDGDDKAVLARLKAAFHKSHAAHFGFAERQAELVIDAVSIEATGESVRPKETATRRKLAAAPKPVRKTRFFSKGSWREARIHHRADLKPGAKLKGPALIVAPRQTVVVEPGWNADVTPHDHLLLTRAKAPSRAKRDPLSRDVFAGRLASIAEQMGETLLAHAASTSVRERRDFSCAIFDAQGQLVAGGSHMPVHLGAMDACVQAVIRANAGKIRPGDVFAHNAPHHGGVDLPTITVCTPVFDRVGGKRILFWVASRARHADVGGLAPASLSPRATQIEDEGALIDTLRIVAGGRFQERAVLEALMTARYPARNPVQNLADLKAQIAANARGVEALRAMVADQSWRVVNTCLANLRADAAKRVEALVATMADAQGAIEMDNGAIVRVAIHVDAKARRARVDFTGASAQRSDNFNAPEAVTRAAVLYVLRALAGADAPLNAGLLDPIDIVIAKGSLLSPDSSAAVGAGALETSQAVTDALFSAFGQLGSAQGTMNNLAFGDIRQQHYETIGSGAPAGDGFDGAGAVQTHMTNARMVDPEVLESRHPVMVQDVHILRGSGGKGRWNAGDGVSRTLRFLEDMQLAIVSGRRVVPAPGALGGEPGRLGRNLVRRADGHIETLQGCDQTQVRAGDTITIETPTGGGYGPRG